MQKEYQKNGFSFNQPPYPERKKPSLTLATYKDLKLGYDKIRLNTWCEDVNFTLITP